MRIPMIAGNWKLHKTLDEATALVNELIPAVADNDKVEIVVAPVYTALSKVAEVIAGSNIKLAAQNCYPEPQGAFTGEVSAPLLKDAGCQYIIIGHSERRQLFGETDEVGQPQGPRRRRSRPRHHPLHRRNSRRARGRPHVRRPASPGPFRPAQPEYRSRWPIW